MNEVLNSKISKGISAVKHPDTNQFLNIPNSSEFLNEYFVNIAQKLVDNLPPSSNINSDNGDYTDTHIRFDSFISVDKIKQILKDFSPCKSSGCLKISSKLYLDGFEVMHEQLSFIINLSLRTKIFPTAWKKSIVTPIPKKGDRCVLSNIRPISLIHIGGKLMEKVVNELLMSYLTYNKILSPKQFGFVKGKSTIDCIAIFLHEVLHNINNNLFTGCLFLDYSKAFDCVNHKLLISKLKKYGILDFSWFENYLTDRQQGIWIKDPVSSFKSISTGVPQGPVLGPTLFDIYINDITNLPLQSQLLLYADNIVIYHSGNTFDEIYYALQRDLNIIASWSINNNLTISAPKSKALLIGRQHLLNKSPITKQMTLSSQNLEWVNTFTYLGLPIDYLLSFDSAIENMHRKAA